MEAARANYFIIKSVLFEMAQTGTKANSVKFQFYEVFKLSKIQRHIVRGCRWTLVHCLYQPICMHTRLERYISTYAWQSWMDFFGQVSKIKFLMLSQIVWCNVNSYIPESSVSMHLQFYRYSGLKTKLTYTTHINKSHFWFDLYTPGYEERKGEDDGSICIPM